LVYTTDIARTLIGREQISQWTTRFNSDDSARINTTHTFDRVERAFEVAQGVIVPSGDYGFRDTWMEYEGSGRRVVSGRIRYGGGDFYGGARQHLPIAPGVRPRPPRLVRARDAEKQRPLPPGALSPAPGPTPVDP